MNTHCYFIVIVVVTLLGVVAQVGANNNNCPPGQYNCQAYVGCVENVAGTLPDCLNIPACPANHTFCFEPIGCPTSPSPCNAPPGMSLCSGQGTPTGHGALFFWDMVASCPCCVSIPIPVPPTEMAYFDVLGEAMMCPKDNECSPDFACGFVRGLTARGEPVA